jgi:putative flippase GtrA
LKEKISKLWHFCTTPEMISYLVFGVLTTIVNIAVFSFCHDLLCWSWEVSNLLAWLLAVIFAFFTNKLFVFRSKSFAPRVFFFELVSFFGARLLSLGVDMAGMWLCLDVIQMHSLLAKIIVNFFVILINYILSKLIIFKKKRA